MHVLTWYSVVVYLFHFCSVYTVLMLSIKYFISIFLQWRSLIKYLFTNRNYRSSLTTFAYRIYWNVSTPDSVVCILRYISTLTLFIFSLCFTLPSYLPFTLLSCLLFLCLSVSLFPPNPVQKHLSFFCLCKYFLLSFFFCDFVAVVILIYASFPSAWFLSFTLFARLPAFVLFCLFVCHHEFFWFVPLLRFFLRPRGLTFTWWGCCGLYLWQKSTELPHSFLFCSCVCFALSTVFHSINCLENSPLSHSALLVLLLPYWSFQLYNSLWKPPSALIESFVVDWA